MAYQTETERLCAEIQAAKSAVAQAQAAHSRGGSLDAVNRADRRLFEAQERLQEFRDGRVPDRR